MRPELEEELNKILRRKDIIQRQLSYLDLQIMWNFITSMWKFRLMKDSHFYDMDEEIKWETSDRTWRDYEDVPLRNYEDWYDISEADINPQPKNKGKVKGKTHPGRPQYARPGTVKGYKRK